MNRENGLTLDDPIMDMKKSLRTLEGKAAYGNEV